MTWPQIALVAWFTLGALLTIGHVGKTREPTTALTAVINTVFTVGLIWLVILA